MPGIPANHGIHHEQVTGNVLEGEPRQREHLKRQPCGTVPVMDGDGPWVRETDAIRRSLDAIGKRPSAIPDTART